MHHDSNFGSQLRQWRQRRRMSQLDLAAEAELSTRHLSFVETGRAKPSRAMVSRLGEVLELPLRHRNGLLLAAGYAPDFPERALDDRAISGTREMIQRILDCHMPFPSLAVDRHWTLVASNAAVAGLLAGVATEMLSPPLNVLRLSLHPRGLAPQIVNLADWKHHVLDRLRRQVEQSADPVLETLAEELRRYPAPTSQAPAAPASPIAVPLILDTPAGRLTFLSTTTIFGTPVEVTVSELAIESFFPADSATAQRLAALTGSL